MLLKTVLKGIKYGLGLFIFAVLTLFFCNYWVLNSSKNKVFAEIEDLPSNDIALVLGTNPLIRNRFQNPYFYTRMEAAYKLYDKGKVKHIIVSGDNGRKSYDEPTEMKKDLMKRGVPESAITLDYAGFRTLDSVVRCKEVFQQNKVTIVSQEFHNYRAVFIGQKYGMDVIAYNASPVYRSIRSKTKIREYFARCKAVLDLYLLRKEPKYLGKKIEIKI